MSDWFVDALTISHCQAVRCAINSAIRAVIQWMYGRTAAKDRRGCIRWVSRKVANRKAGAEIGVSSYQGACSGFPLSFAPRIFRVQCGNLFFRKQQICGERSAARFALGKAPVEDSKSTSWAAVLGHAHCLWKARNPRRFSGALGRAVGRTEPLFNRLAEEAIPTANMKNIQCAGVAIQCAASGSTEEACVLLLGPVAADHSWASHCRYTFQSAEVRTCVTFAIACSNFLLGLLHIGPLGQRMARRTVFDTSGFCAHPL